MRRITRLPYSTRLKTTVLCAALLVGMAANAASPDNLANAVSPENLSLASTSETPRDLASPAFWISPDPKV